MCTALCRVPMWRMNIWRSTCRGKLVLTEARMKIPFFADNIYTGVSCDMIETVYQNVQLTLRL